MTGSQGGDIVKGEDHVKAAAICIDVDHNIAAVWVAFFSRWQR